MKFALKTVAASVLLASATGAFAQKGETVKIAWLDPLSGLMAAVGTNQLKSFQFICRRVQQEERRRCEVRDHRHRQQAEPAERPPALCARPWTRACATSCRAMARRSGAGLHRCARKAQRTQPGQGSGVPELLGGRPRPDQQQVQLLALPPRRRHLHEDGSAVHLHEGPARRQEGLPAEPELLARSCRWPSSPRKRWRASAPTSRSSAKTCTRWPRCATSRPTSPRSRPRVPTP